MTAFYNEIDPKAAAWLRELIKRGLIAPGEVDERSILDVRPDDLAGFSQCHFFAGIGVWSYALRRAGWADDRPVWTGSCPCQPFSAAGKGDEFADERHLWPAWFRLIRERRPVAVFGEQVASKDALSWLDHVSTDLEAEGYAVGAVSTVACGFGAPHIRQRLYFVAESKLGIRDQLRPAGEQGRDTVVGRSEGIRQGNGAPGRSRIDAASESLIVADASSGRRELLTERSGVDGALDGAAGTQPDAGSRCDAGRLAHAEHAERRPVSGHREDERDGNDSGRPEAHGVAGACGEVRQLADPEHDRRSSRDRNERSADGARSAHRDDVERCSRLGNPSGRGLGIERDAAQQGSGGHTDGAEQLGVALGDANGQRFEGTAACAEQGGRPGSEQPGACNGFWSNAEWIPCRDGKARPTESRLVALAPGVAGGMVSRSDSGESSKAEKAAWVTPDCNNHRDGTKVRTDSNLGIGTHGVSLHHLAQLAGENDNGQVHGVISAIGGDCETSVRGLPQDTPLACPPSGQESSQQRGIEFADFVSLLPQARALAELHGDAYTAQAVSALLQGFGEAWSVQHASDSGETIWRSLDEEGQDRLRVGFNSGVWVRDCVFPLVTGAPARVVRLRGYGNAINAEQARHFIEAYNEVRAA